MFALPLSVRSPEIKKIIRQVCAKHSFLDLDDEADYLAENIRCSLDQANMFIDYKEEYLVSVGGSGYGAEDIEPFLDKNAKCYIDELELMNFIVEHTGLERNLVTELYTTEQEYYKLVGHIKN